MSTQFPKLFPKLYPKIKLRTRSRIHIQNVYKQNNKQNNRQLSLQNLSLQTGSAAIISIPPGAKIFIDDIDTGIKSSAIISDIDSLSTHTLKLTLDGYEDYIDDTFEVSDGSIDAYYALLIPTPYSTQTGNLNITGSLSNTEFGAVTMSTGIETSIDGITPTTFSDIPAGIYAYEASSAGPPESVSMGIFEVLPGRTTNFNISLGPIDPSMAFTLIESIPIGADIYVDGYPLGAKTSFFRGFTTENHTYELRKPGYQTKTGSFLPVIDIPNIVSETLQPTSDSGSVILIAGAAVLGMIITSNM